MGHRKGNWITEFNESALSNSEIESFINNTIVSGLPSQKSFNLTHKSRSNAEFQSALGESVQKSQKTLHHSSFRTANDMSD